MRMRRKKHGAERIAACSDLLITEYERLKNILNSITSLTTAENVNIENMLNKSKKDYAYTMLDIKSDRSDAIAEEITKIDGVIKVRVI